MVMAYIPIAPNEMQLIVKTERKCVVIDVKCVMIDGSVV